jgi:hypothetical protein
MTDLNALIVGAGMLVMLGLLVLLALAMQGGKK